MNANAKETMKQLIIVRHAKSDWGDFNLKDVDRPLNPRGHRNAPEMVQRLVDKGFRPDLIVSSTALRAHTTAKYFAAGWQIKPEQIKAAPTIYEASIPALLSAINGFDDQFQNIAVFGHNPGLTDLVNYLTDDYLANMPTCSVAIIEFPFEEWKLASAATGRLVLFDFPKSGLD